MSEPDLRRSIAEAYELAAQLSGFFGDWTAELARSPLSPERLSRLGEVREILSDLTQAVEAIASAVPRMSKAIKT